MKISAFARIPRVVCHSRLLTLSLSLLAAAASSLACTAPTNSIFVNPCADATYGSTLVQFESDTVQAYLSTHGLPSTDSSVIYTYGRTDLRTELRGLMLTRLLLIINTSSGSRTAAQQSIYNWFLNRVWTNEKSLTQYAVNDRNNFLANKCAWTPDPDLASQYGFFYDGGAFCGNNLGQFLLSPTVPAESFFQAEAFKNTYGTAVAQFPSGAGIMNATAVDVNTNIAYAAIPAASVGVSLGLGISTSIKLILKSLSARAVVLAKTRALLTGAVEDVVEDGAAEVTAASAGPGIIVGIMIEAGVAAGTEAYNADTTLAQLNDLDVLNTNSHAAPPDLVAMLSDPSTGLLKLTTAFTSATLPETFVTATLPAHRATDPVFQIAPITGGVSGSAVASLNMTYLDWAEHQWQVETWGGWFIQTATVDGKAASSITASLSVQYPGTPTTALITAGRFSADRFVVTSPLNSFQTDCDINPATGVSDSQGGSAVSFCSSFVVRHLLLLDASGNFQDVTLPLQTLPVFPEGSQRTLNFNTSLINSVQRYQITASGNPAPFISAVGSLPAGFTFVDSGTLGLGFARIDSPATIGAGALLNPNVVIQATNGAGSVTQTLTLTLKPGPITFLSPTSLTLTRGVPSTFNVSVQGKPPLTITPIFNSTPNVFAGTNIFPDGMTFIDYSDGSGTLRGTPAADAVGCNPNNPGPCDFFIKDADNNFIDQLFTITVVSPATPQLSGPASATFQPGKTTISLFQATGAQSPTHFSATIPAAISSWLTFTDLGGGSAELSGTPPAGTSGTYNVTVSLTADGLTTPVQSNFVASVLGPPNFEGPSNAFVQATKSGLFFFTTDSNAAITLAGQPPPGVTFVPNSGDTNLAGMTMYPPAGSGGIYPLVISATNAYGTTTQTFQLEIYEQATFSTPNSASLMVGVNRKVSVLANGFPRNPGVLLPSTHLSNGLQIQLVGGSLPNGVTILPAAADGSNSGDVIISGAPAAGTAGTYPLSLSAANEISTQVGTPASEVLTLTVLAAGDVNGDGVTNCADYTLVKSALNTKVGQAKYNAAADFNVDGVVNLLDLAFLTAHLPTGTKCP